MTHQADLDVVAALNLAETHAAGLADRLRPATPRLPLPPSLWPTKRVKRDGRRWRWSVTEHDDLDDPEVVLAAGHTRTQWGAHRRGDRARHRIHAERVKARDEEARS